MPKDNKTMRNNKSTRNQSSSNGYERSNLSSSGSPLNGAGFQDYADMFWDTAYGHDDPEIGEARLKTLLSGVPYVGPMVQAYDQAQMLEDLYKRTGKVPAYPGVSGIGYGGVASVASNAVAGAAKIAAGKHDLYEYYSGEPDNFRQMMNGAYL